MYIKRIHVLCMYICTQFWICYFVLCIRIQQITSKDGKF